MPRRTRGRYIVRFQTLRRGEIPVSSGRGVWPLDVRVVRQSDTPSSRIVLGGTLDERRFETEDEIARHLAAFGTVQWSPVLGAGSDEQACPICAAGVPKNERYPAYICPVCMLEVVDELGRALQFSNIDATGGFVATVIATGAHQPDGVCWVRGVRCCADEGKFGGIVIEPVELRR